MNVLIDTNIALDFLLERTPFYDVARKIFAISESNIIAGFVSASAITDIYYLSKKTLKNRDASLGIIKKLLQLVYVATISSDEIYRAVEIEWNDFEDAGQYAVGKRIAADYIVTRNPRDFSGSDIQVIEPEQFLELFLQDKEKRPQAASC